MVVITTAVLNNEAFMMWEAAMFETTAYGLLIYSRSGCRPDLYRMGIWILAVYIKMNQAALKSYWLL